MAPLPAPGLYRISTGARVARETTWAQVDGAWRPVRPPSAGEVRARPAAGGTGRREARGPAPLDAASPGAPTAHTSAYLRADTYVVRGASSKAVPKPDGQGLELVLNAHPSAVYVDAALPLTLLLDGRPVPGAFLLVRRADSPYAERKINFSAKTDAQGRSSIKFPLAGAYVIEAQTPPSSPGDRPADRAYISTLTVEATE